MINVNELSRMPLVDRQRYFEQVVTRAELTAKEKFILEKSFGVYEDDKWPYAKIGEEMPSIDLPRISKQAVEQTRTRLQKKLGEKVWTVLSTMFPEPVSETTIAKAKSRVRTAILKYLRAANENSNVQYAHVHRELGLPIPAHRAHNADILTELESCVAYMQDYNARNMGKYRYCTMCETIKPSAGPNSEFYQVQNSAKGDGSTYTYQICRACNTKRCVRFAQTKDGTLHGASAPQLASV